MIGKKIIFLGIFILNSCVPDIYLVDRHTVMEMEASGEWPELDKIFYSQVKTAGPVGFPKEPETKRKKRVKNMLNGEFIYTETP